MSLQNFDAEYIAAKVNGAPQGDGWIGRCLFQERHQNGDCHPSMRIFRGRDGHGLLSCKIRCATTGELMAQFRSMEGVDGGSGVQPKPPEKSKTPPPWKRPIKAEYLYQDETGAGIGKVVKFSDGLIPKCLQQRPGPDRWVWKSPKRKILYKLPEMLSAVERGDWIFLVEGEGDVETIMEAGFAGTSNPEGAAAWSDHFAEQVPRAAKVAVLWDNDKAGIERRDKVLESLRGKVTSLKRIDLSDLPSKAGADVTDWIEARHTPEELGSLLLSTPEWEPAEGAGIGGKEEPLDNLPIGYSEHALALAFTELNGKKFRYTAKWGQWHGWSGQRWRVDDTLRVPDLVRSVCKHSADDPEVTPGQVNRICSAKTVTGVITLARTDRQHAATVDQWDANPWLLNTPGETINLQTGETWPNRQEDYQIKMTAIAPGGDCRRWLDFLKTVTGGDDDLVSYLKRLSGYCLTGNVQEHSFHFFWGSGRNGKTTFTGALMGIMDSYARPAPVEAFMEGKQREHPTAIAGLQGVRLAVAPETGQGVMWNEALLSRLTGGDTLTARFMRGDYFDFEPTHKLMVVGNHRPRIRGINEAMKSRLHLIPFNVTIPREKRDPKLPEKLKAEWPGILSWMIDGCFDWINSGLRPPTVVVEATEEYFSNEDTVGKWIEDCCITENWVKASVKKLYESWKEWTAKNNEYDPGKRAFGDSLEQRGHSRIRDMTGRFHDGIDLKP